MQQTEPKTLSRSACATDDGGIRQAYGTPHLTLYGRIADLTAAGSGHDLEVADTRECRNSPNKVRC